YDNLDDSLADISMSVQEAAKKFKNYDFELVTEEDVEEQRSRINKIETAISSATSENKNFETSTSDESKAASVKVEPEVDPVEFANKVTEQLTVSAQIEVEGKVSDPASFADSISEQVKSVTLGSSETTEAIAKAIVSETKVVEEAAKTREQSLEHEQSVVSETTTKMTKADAERERNLQAEHKIRRAIANTEIQTIAKEEAAREKNLQAEQKIQRAIDNAESKRIAQEESAREKNLQAEQKIQKAIDDAETKRVAKQESEREKNLQAEQKIQKAIDDAEAKRLAKEEVAREKNLQAEQKIRRAVEKATGKNEAQSYDNQNKTATAAYNNLYKQAKKYYSLLKKESSKTITATEEKQLNKLRSEWEQATKGIGKYSIAVEGTAKSLDTARQAADKFFTSNAESANAEIDKRIQNYAEQIKAISANPNMFFFNGEQLTKTSTELGKVESIINQLSNHPIDLSTEEARKEIWNLEGQVVDFFDKLEKGAKEVSVQNISNNISQYLEKNTALSLKFRIELQRLSDELQQGVSSDRLKDIYARFLEIQQAARKTGQEGRNALDTISQRLDDMDSKFLAQLLSWQDIIRYIREVASAVIELDTALTEMRKVSDESLSSLQKYQDLSFNIADQIGVTSTQLQQSTADFMRLGESLTDAAESAKVANVLMNVSEFESISEATDALISMASAYSDLEKMDIVDRLNEIGNNYSISTDGIATALQNSASALVTASNDIDESIALITAGNVVVQDPDKVGNGIRTIALRLTGTKEASETLKELGEETDDMIMTQSKLRATIMDATKAASENGKGFDILDDNGNYKSTYEIMLGLAELYDKIIESDKKLGTNNLNLLLETIAGKNRANIAASILQNPDILKNVFDDSSLNSANSALEENDKYLESILGHIEQFKNAVQELFHYLLETGTINKVIEIATGFINFLTGIVKTLGSTGSIAVLGSLIVLMRKSGKILTNIGINLPEILTAINNITKGTGSLVGVLKILFPTLSAITSSMGSLLGILAPYAPYIIAIGAAIAGTYALFDHLTVTVEEANEAISSFNSKYDKLESSLDSHRELVNNVADSYETLAKGVDTLTNKNLTLSDEDYAEYLNITKQLGEAYPGLIKSTDEYGGYILTIGTNYDIAAESLRGYLKEEDNRVNFQ
nr:phage tail tape measure protein [Treponema sp.]